MLENIRYAGLTKCRAFGYRHLYQTEAFGETIEREELVSASALCSPGMLTRTRPVRVSWIYRGFEAWLSKGKTEFYLIAFFPFPLSPVAYASSKMSHR